jgi:site-specific DNA-methyltransferase (adenine-specific)
MKINNIYLGDCIKILNTTIKKKSIDLIFADPPYNLSGKGLKWMGNKTGGDWLMINENWDKMSYVNYFSFTENWLKGCFDVLKNNGSIYVCGTFHNIGEILITLKKLGFLVKNIITWQKTNAMPNMTKRVYTHSSEFIVWAVKGKNWIFNYSNLKKINPEKQKDGSEKQMRDIWSLPLVQGKERIKDSTGKAAHPTQKPEVILERIITASSNKGDLILDPFMGSGTTAYVAKKLKRNFIGIEKEKKYINIIKKRIL